MEFWKHQLGAIDFTLDVKTAWWQMGMGTGKTLAAYGLFDRLNAGRAVVLAPKKILNVWEDEYNKFPDAFGFKVAIIRDGSVAERADKIVGLLTTRQKLMVVLNYDIMIYPVLAKAVYRFNPGMFYLDESHRIKNANAKRSKMTYKVSSKVPYRIAATGTFLPNSPLDAHGQMKFLAPNVLPEKFADFRRHYAVLRPLDSNPYVQIVKDYKNLDELERLVSPYSYVVETDDVVELPPISIIDRRINFESNTVRKQYKNLNRDYFLQIDQGVITLDNALVKALRLRQLTGGFLYADKLTEGVNASTDKLQAAMDIVEDLDSIERVVIFARYTDEIKLIRSGLDKLGITNGEISGKHDDYRHWRKGSYRVLVIQVDSGSEGIDLTDARYAIVYSPPESGGQYQQMLRRIHRPGAKTKVFIYRLIVNDTIDEDIFEALDNKINLSHKILIGIKHRAALPY